MSWAEIYATAMLFFWAALALVSAGIDLQNPRANASDVVTSFVIALLAAGAALSLITTGV